MADKKIISRRDFLKQTASGTAGLAAAACFNRNLFGAPYIKNSKLANKVIVLGLDGMDPVLLDRYMKQGKMPTFQKLMNKGWGGKLATTMPPQSPVAWSSFITGTNPGGNGIFDFIHRDPAKFLPYLSTSRSHPGGDTIDIGKWKIPVESGRVELMRKGQAFWSILEENNISASLFKMPANFPIESNRTRAVSGMSTPDLLGSYGTSTYFTDTYVPGGKDFTGGRVVNVQPVNNVIKATLSGPRNDLNTEIKNAEIDFTVHRDPVNPVAKITIQDKEILLKEGEWSDWVPLKFELMPMFVSVSGMVRIYLKEVHPGFKLYMSPINIDPMDPTLPICNPSGYSKEVGEAIGRFYTQGFPEDTKALSNGIFSNEEFLTQAKIVLDERLKAFEYEFNNFKEGMFFFYFSTIDQNTHMMWANMDPTHPLYDERNSTEVKTALEYYYTKMDQVLKKTLSKVDSHTTLMVLSDHGFAPFAREFHLSTWMVENGFTTLTDPSVLGKTQFYQHVDWKNTKAYAMGINGIYVNVRGREIKGSVAASEVEQIKQEIISKLNDVRDPENGKRMIVQVYDTKKIYSGPFMALAPDIVVGYASGYRISDESVLGKFPNGLVGDRTNKWAADHCMDPSVVPGIFFSNKQVTAKNPGLWDLAPTILNEFRLEVPKTMDGRPIFSV